jgi:alpha-D-ribose 1-methylphosphonate 5-triphosphate synthase subunit PhnI
MAGPISRQPLAFPNSQHFRLQRLDRPEAPPSIAVAAAMTAAPYRDISLSPFACHLSPAVISPWLAPSSAPRNHSISKALANSINGMTPRLSKAKGHM